MAKAKAGETWPDGKPALPIGTACRIKSMVTNTEGGSSAKAKLLRQSTPGEIVGRTEGEYMGKRAKLYQVKTAGGVYYIHEARIEVDQ